MIWHAGARTSSGKETGEGRKPEMGEEEGRRIIIIIIIIIVMLTCCVYI